MLATSRVRHFRKHANGTLTDTGWELVQYPATPEVWEPADTIFVRGHNGPEKVTTGIRIVQDSDCVAPTPLAGNVLIPRTGTAA